MTGSTDTPPDALGTARPPSAPHPLARELAQLMSRAFGTTLRDAGDAGARLPALRVARAPRAAGAAALAAAHPGGPAARRDALGLYTRCLQHYRSQVQARLRPGRPDDDAGLAAAYFVLANLAALAGNEPDPAQLGPVEHQLRALIAPAAAWRSAALAERQSLCEQLGLLGVLVNESRLAARRQGAHAQSHLQQAARRYLQQLLGFDPDLLVLTAQGLGAAEALH